MQNRAAARGCLRSSSRFDDFEAMAEAARRPRRVLEIDVGERLPVGVADMKHCRSSLGSGSSTDQGGGKRCAIVTAFAVAQHAAQTFASLSMPAEARVGFNDAGFSVPYL